MGKALSKAKQEEMFQVWYQSRNNRTVANSCLVSESVVKKYKKKNHWVERAGELDSRVEKEDDAQLIKQRKFNRGLLNRIKQIYASALLGEVSDTCPKCGHKVTVSIPKTPPKFRDIDVIMKLEHEIFGRTKRDSDEPKLIKYPIKPPDEDDEDDEDEDD